MDIKRLSSSLLFRIIVAIILGIVCSFFFPDGLARVFVTFNGLFGNFLGFFIPVLIFALITPAIAGLGRGAGKWLAITTGIAYGSALVSGLISWGVATALYPWLLASQASVAAADIEEGALSPYISVEMPAPMQVMTALILAFVVGVAMTTVKSDTLFSGVADLRRVVMKVISSFIVPLLPIYIFGMFLSLGMNGNLASVLTAFAKVLLLAILMSFVLLILQFLFAGTLATRNPFASLKNMMPAYFTALGTSSSAATIPVTYECARKNGVSQSVAGFVVSIVRHHPPLRIDDEDYAVRLRHHVYGRHGHPTCHRTRLHPHARCDHGGSPRCSRWRNHGSCWPVVLQPRLQRRPGGTDDRRLHRHRLLRYRLQRHWRRCHCHGGGQVRQGRDLSPRS